MGPSPLSLMRGWLVILGLTLGQVSLSAPSESDSSSDSSLPAPLPSPSLQDGMGSDAENTLLAKKRKKKKKKKKKKQKVDDEGDYGDDYFGPQGVGEIEVGDNRGTGVHREQEGMDTPYWAEVAVSTDISFLTQEVDTSDDDPVSSSNYALGLSWLFLLGSAQIGPDFSFQSTTVATPTVTTDETTGKPFTATTEATTSEYAVGALFKWNFGDLDKDDLIIFGYGGAAYRAASSKVGEGDEVKSSGMLIRAGGGANLFLDSNVAFNPRAEYYQKTDQAEEKPSEEIEAPTVTTSGFRLLLGIAVFI